MPLLNFNFGDVPDQIEPIAPGQYELEVAEIPDIKPTEKGTGNNLIVKFRVTSEGKYKGRQIQDYIFLNEMGLVKAKHLIVGLGMPPANGVNTEEMMTRKTKALVIAGTYKDESTGETRQNAKIKDYLKP